MSKFTDSSTTQPFIAIVAGATGATGRWIVGELVSNPQCTKVIALTRSDIADPSATFPSADKEQIGSKLAVHKLNFGELATKPDFGKQLPAIPTVGFCAMGSAPYTEESDFTAPVAFGRACKSAGVNSMFLVSASNAKAGSWLGYCDTIGRREEAFKGMGFGRLGIYRPGMMDRQEKRRTKELFGYILPSFMKIDTRDIAKTMVASVGRMKEGTHEFSHAEMKRFAAGDVTSL